MADDVKLGIGFDKDGVKTWVKLTAKQFDKLEKKLARKRAKIRLTRIREDKRSELTIAKNKEKIIRRSEQMEKRLSRKRARNRLKQMRERARVRKKQDQDVAREKKRKVDSRRAFGRSVGRGVGRGVGITAGIVGFNLASLFDPEEVLGFERSLAVLAGQMDLTTGAQARLGAKLTEVSLQTGVFRTDVLRGFEAIIEKSGDLKLAEDVILSMSKASVGLEADMGDLGLLAAAMGTAFNASGKDAIKFFEMLAAQGDKGQVTLKDLAMISQDVFSRAKGFGVVGAEGVSAVGALLQTTPLGSADERKTAVGTLLEMFGTEGSKIRKQFGVETRTKSGDLRNPATILKDVIRATKGNLEDIKKVFTGTALAPFLTSSRQFQDTKKFADIDEFLNIGKGASGLIQKRFTRVEKTGSVTFDKFQNIITMLSESALTPALTELSKSLTELLRDKDKMDALTNLFKQIGKFLGGAVEAAVFFGSVKPKTKTKGLTLDKIFGFPTPFVPFGSKAGDFESKGTGASGASRGNSNGGVNIDTTVIIDDRGNTLKTRTRVNQQNNSNTGKTLIGGSR